MLHLLIAIWILAGAYLVDDMNILKDEQSIFAQAIVLTLITIFAPAIYATMFVESAVELILGEECFDDDG